MNINTKKLLLMFGASLILGLPNVTIYAQEVENHNEMNSNELIASDLTRSETSNTEEYFDEIFQDKEGEVFQKDPFMGISTETLTSSNPQNEINSQLSNEKATEYSMNESENSEIIMIQEDVIEASLEEKEKSKDNKSEPLIIDSSAEQDLSGDVATDFGKSNLDVYSESFNDVIVDEQTNNLQLENAETTETVPIITAINSSESGEILPDDFYVEKVENLPEDFIKGVDISTLIAQEQSGVKYFDLLGQEVDLIPYLAQNGVNYIRVRVWNDPYDADGNGYGGGNNDLEKAIEIGKRATEAGLKVLVDFHYSDFWADPGRQLSPKAWQNMTVDEKSKALYEFTKESLQKLTESGVNVSMVQVGNETTGSGIAGEKGDERYQLFREGTRAIREIDPGIQIVLHFTNPEKTETILNYAKGLSENAIDYDVFATSYYSYWHGKLDNLKSVLQQVKQEYGKNTLIAETSYAYTLEEGDGQGNVISTTNQTVLGGYEATIQGQTNSIRDIIAAANEADALGIFYWEPAWVPVGTPDWQQNISIWENYGSGWASSHAIGYDPNVTDSTYGGSAWDNQALFDFNGKALPSIKVFNFVETGYGKVPEKIINEEVTEEFKSLLDNPSFEREDLTSYTISEEYVSRLNDTPKDGEYALHFWSDQMINFDVEQVVELLPGIYQFNLMMQGDQTGQSENIFAYVKYSDGTLLRAPINLKGYANWQETNIEFTVNETNVVVFGLHVTADAGGWGTTDNWLLKKIGDTISTPNEDESEGAPGEQSPVDENSTGSLPPKNEVPDDAVNIDDDGQDFSKIDNLLDNSMKESKSNAVLKPDLSLNNLAYSSVLPNTGFQNPYYFIMLGCILLFWGMYILLSHKMS